MTSDDTQARGDVPWKQVGIGMKLGLYCMRCHSKNCIREGGEFFGHNKKFFSCASCKKKRAERKRLEAMRETHPA